MNLVFTPTVVGICCMNDLKIDEGFAFHTEYLVLQYYYPEVISNTTLIKIRHVPGIITIVKLMDYNIL
jgi:hypothetical protein